MAPPTGEYNSDLKSNIVQPQYPRRTFLHYPYNLPDTSLGAVT